MSRIRGSNTQPELVVRQLLWRKGFRFRLHSKALPGKPDLVLPRWQAAVFIHGCFWHRHEGCSLFRLPKSRPEFWDQKLGRNRERDREAVNALAEDGWRIAVMWECAIRSNPVDAVGRLERWLRGTRKSAEISAASGKVRSHRLR
jgi:DNA mismatch endonuclease (patch repair protein)